jgi:hypothetical protein
MSNLKNRLDIYLNNKEKLISDFREYLENKQVPLKTRWDMFTEYGEEILPIDIWFVHIPSIDSHYKVTNGSAIQYTEYLGYSKFETIYMNSLLGDFEDHYEEEVGSKFEAIDQLKEEILTTGLAGFILDW